MISVTPTTTPAPAGTPSGTTAPLISVVVCSYNGAARIGGCLDALTGQRDAPAHEIIVVDDGSTDDTAAVASSYPGVRVLAQTPNGGLSAARNAGIAAATGQLVAFTDDDCVPPADWLSKLAAAWQGAPNHVQGIGGHTHAKDTDSYARRYVTLNNPLAPLELGSDGNIAGRILRYLSPAPAPSHRRYVSSLVGANMSFRRDALLQIGGFDPIIRFGGDEEDLCRRLREGHDDQVLWVDPAITVAHDFDRSMRDTLRRSRAYGRGNGRDYARRGGIPALRPMPILMLAGALGGFLTGLLTGPGGLRSRALCGLALAVTAAVVVPAAVHRRMLNRAIRSRRADQLGHPYVAAAQELYATVGFVEEYRRLKKISGTKPAAGGR
jgi:glycosyltransferase involved in cell wall biosynthesis